MGKSRSKSTHILIVDDDIGARESLEAILEDDFSVLSVDSGHKALKRLESENFDLVLLDVTMPDMDGIETLKRIKKNDESIDVIMVSAIDRAQEATASIQTGAYDYITKPVDPDSIINVITRALQKRMLEKEVSYLRSEVSQFVKDRQIIGQSSCMQEVFGMIDKVAATTSNVLISGESGTGKELIAQAIHDRSQRSNKPFVAINCAAIPSELMESELYGHEKGAFTGAQTRSIGKFEYADNGTVFLDEIASLKLELQAKLLRSEFTRVGGNLTIKVDTRIIAASNVSLKHMVDEEKFREDLFFRLNVIPIELPPLRKRDGDIALLANYFLDKFNRKLNQNIEGITADAMTVLESHHWPGNIRELENLIERLVVLRANESWIDTKDLPFELLFNEKEDQTDKRVDQGLLEARQVFERSYIQRALRICNWNQAKTARMLNIHRNTLLQKIKSLNIHWQGE
jgi:DNA-binding NtrC family response regulator